MAKLAGQGETVGQPLVAFMVVSGNHFCGAGSYGGSSARRYFCNFRVDPEIFENVVEVGGEEIFRVLVDRRFLAAKRRKKVAKKEAEGVMNRSQSTLFGFSPNFYALFVPFCG